MNVVYRPPIFNRLTARIEEAQDENRTIEYIELDWAEWAEYLKGVGRMFADCANESTGGRHMWNGVEIRKPEPLMPKPFKVWRTTNDGVAFGLG